MTTYTLIPPGENADTELRRYQLVQPEEQPRSFLRELGRQGVGLPARYAIEGINSILGGPVDALSGGFANFVGIPQLATHTGQGASEALTRWGFPEPETPTERVVGDVSRGLTQAAVTGGGAALAAPFKLVNAGTADRVMRALASRFDLQAASAAGASTAGGTTREMGGGPLLQTIASILGGFAGPVVAPAVVPRVSPTGFSVKTPQAFSDIWRLGREAIRPFRPGGQEQIVGSTLRRMAEDEAAAQAAMANPRVFVPGSSPTAAEAARDIGISSFERAMANHPEIGTDLAKRVMEQNAARLAALRKTAGTEQELKAAVADREANANVDYETARNTPITISPRDSRIIGKLMDRPSFKRAWTKAEELSAEQNMRPDEISLDNPAFMHNLKKGFDSQLEVPLDKTTKAAITGTKNDFLEVLDNLSPEYAIARGNFAAASPAIDRMTALQTIEPNAQTSAPNILGDPILSQAGFKRAVPKALEPPEGTRVTPEDQATLDAIQADLDRSVSSTTAGKALGSNTAQNLASMNVGVQTFGTGAMFDPIANLLATVFTKPYEWMGVEPAVRQLVNKALLNPELAAQLMRDAPMSRASQTLAQIFERGMGPVGAGTAAGINETAGAGGTD